MKNKFIKNKTKSKSFSKNHLVNEFTKILLYFL